MDLWYDTVITLTIVLLSPDVSLALCRFLRYIRETLVLIMHELIVESDKKWQSHDTRAFPIFIAVLNDEQFCINVWSALEM